MLAESQSRKALSRFGSRNDELGWRFKILAARVEVQQGKSLDALHLLTPELPPELSKSDLAIRRQMLLAVAHIRLGHLEQAAQAIEQAQTLCDVSHSQLLAEVLSFVGIIDLSNDRTDHADLMFRSALDLARKQNDKYLIATILLNLGVVKLNTERYDEAIYWSNASSGIAKSIDAASISEKALANVGWAYLSLGDFEKALANFQEAEQQAEKIGAKYDQAGWLAQEGLAQYRLGQLRESEASYRKSLALAQDIQNADEILDAEVNLGFLLFQTSSPQAAREMCDRAAQVAKSIGSKSARVYPMFLQALLAEQAGDRQQAQAMLEDMEAASADSPSARWKVEDELAKLRESSGKTDLADRWFRKSISTFEAQRSSLQDDDSRLPFFNNASQVYGDYAEFLVNHGQSDKALQLIDLGRARTLAEGLGIAPRESRSLFNSEVDPRRVARKLNGTILSYWLGTKESYLWAITSTGTRLFKLPKEEEISAQVKSYQRDVLKSLDVAGAGSQAGLSLYNALIGPARGLIPEKGRVFIIPDGSLNQLNFETLLVGDPHQHYWIEDADIVSADSIRMLESFASHPRKSATANLLLIGDPVLTGSTLEDLPNASKEASSIERHFHPEQRLVLTRERALPSAYAASHPERYSYIHFVAHASASRLSPLESAVILSGTPGDPDSFKLYARDIMRHPLRAELVTVSACNGSGTRAYAGEGLVGLSWAFLRAGSHYVAAALWEVDDASTPQLMDDLYTGVERGESPDAALRAAKLAMVHSNGTFRKPLYWASFQIYAGS